MGHVYIDNQEGTIKLRLLPFVTYDKYIELWKDVQKAKLSFSKPTKRKAPEYPELIYAVFKARHIDKLTFKEIFVSIESGKLPNYSGSRKFDTKEKLKTYYSKHRPGK